MLSCTEGWLGWLAGPGSVLVSMGQCSERLWFSGESSWVVSFICLRIFPCPNCKMPVKYVSMPSSCVKILPSLSEYKEVAWALLEVYFFHSSSKLFLHSFSQYDTTWCLDWITWAIPTKNISISMSMPYDFSPESTRDSGPQLGSSQRQNEEKWPRIKIRREMCLSSCAEACKLKQI